VIEAGFERVVGTSGTILSLGTMAAHEALGEPPAEIRNLRVPAKQIRRIREKATSLPLAERLRLPGLEPRRADLVVAGSVLLDTILRQLGADEITLCDLALREGVILDYIRRHRTRIVRAGRYPDVRRRSVIELAERCHYWPEHARQVASLSLGLFDQTRGVHGLTDRERQWLEYAALLHDIGVHISYERHHLHSYYLIKNGGLRGFEPEEAEVVALIARYHRRGVPKRRDEGYGGLPRPTRRAVKILASLVRLAEGLDRTRNGVIKELEIEPGDAHVIIRLQAVGDAELELWAAQRQAATLERCIGLPLRFEVVSDIHGQHSDNGTSAPGKTLRRGGNRRVRQDDAAGAAGEVAQRGRASRVLDRVELVGARQGRHQGREKAQRAHADDLQPPPRHGLR
jgi:exopolyphosphatase/guanosine-5'-triphosphate,3'-diphosphate pyrophosphatase